MNEDSITSGYQQQEHFNFNQPNTSYYQQTLNSDVALGAQNTQINLPQDYAYQHPGTQYKLANQYPGTSHPFPPPPGTNPFLAQHFGAGFQPAQCTGSHQYSTQNPANSKCPTIYPGPYQFGGTTQNTGPSKCVGFPEMPPFERNMEYPGNNQPFQERKPFPGTHVRQMAAQFNNGPVSTNENFWQRPMDVSAPNNFNFNFGNNSVGPDGPTQTDNVYQFVGPNKMKGQPKVPEKNNTKVWRGFPKPVFGRNPFRGQDAAFKGVREEKKDKGAYEFNPSATIQLGKIEEGDRIINLIRINHLISSYVKVRSLLTLGQDFQTPVFGDLPEGDELEKTIIRNLSYFLKEEVEKIKFIDLEEKGKITFGDHVHQDPILRASLTVLKTVVSRLESKRCGLVDEKQKLETLETEIKDHLEEMNTKEADAKALKSEVAAEKARIEKLTERLQTERKNNEGVRNQYGKELEQINNIHIHSLHEDLRAVQEKISKETKAFKQKKEELRNLKEQNSILKSCTSERVIKKDNPAKKCGHKTEANNPHPRLNVGGRQMSPARNGRIVM